MRRITSIAMTTLLACLLVAGCGGRPGDEPAQVQGPLVAYLRQGGIAGFSDELVVQPDGAYTVNGRFRTPGTGTLSPAELAGLRTALESSGFAGLPADSPLRIADGFTHTVRYGGREVRAGDGNIPPTLQPVLESLNRILTGHQ
jgi:hypothetical protein